MREQGDAANEWGLPFGQMVLSEAFTLEQSLSLTENLDKLGSARHQIETVRAILTDNSRSEAERVRDALRAVRNDPPPTSLSKIEE
jgi:CRISPR/Cas system-associated protein Cas7 (RAMP superfamily)